MGDALGTQLDLDVTNIAHGGISVARSDGRVVFVSDAIPGERVRVRVTEDRKKSFWRADTVEVLEPSPHRRQHVWREASVERDPAERPGGAEFGHIEPEHQRRLKAEVLRDSLQRMGGVTSDVEVQAVPGRPDGTRWRTRVRLHVGADGRLGPYAARSHEVIPVEDLPLATEAVAAAVPFGESFAGEPFVDVVAAGDGEPRLVVGRQRPSTIVERVGGREFRLADTGFWQVHESAAQTLTDAVQRAIDDAAFDPRATNLDLYGGVGLLAAAVADRFGSTTRITTVEADAGATGYAEENLADLPHARAETGRIERWLPALAATASVGDRAALTRGTVVLDPPRSGAGREVVEALVGLSPAQVVYVACDPVAFARDVGYFRAAGYELQSLEAFDLFPNTHHVEAVGRLARP